MSKGAGYPLWNELTSHLKLSAEDCVGYEIIFPSKENLDQIGHLRDMLGEEWFQKEIIRIFGSDGKFDYLPVHQQVVTIPFISIITTNYDYCIENAAIALSKDITVQYFPELDISRLREGHIFHIHGFIHPKNPERYIGSLILTRKNYDFAYEEDTNLPNFLTHLYEFQTLVFMGFSFADNSLVKIMKTAQIGLESRRNYELQSGLGKRITPKHFVVMHHEAKIKQDTIRELGLLPIFYTGDQDRHSCLQPLLSYIKFRTTGIPYKEPVVYSDMFEDSYHE